MELVQVRMGRGKLETVSTDSSFKEFYCKGKKKGRGSEMRSRGFVGGTGKWSLFRPHAMAKYVTFVMSCIFFS